MSELDEEIQIDCGAASSRRPRPAPKAVAPPVQPRGRQAPVGLKQKPAPPPDAWDGGDGRAGEFGPVDALRAQLVARLEEALARARGDWQPGRWDLRSPTWPYTKIGMLLLRCIALADALAERLSRERES